MDDQQLWQRVIDELEFEPSVNASHIGVSVHDGISVIARLRQPGGEKHRVPTSAA